MKFATLRIWFVLFAVQILLIAVIFPGFLSGRFYFAYVDIGSDSYGGYVPFAIQIARTLASEGFTGWSFKSGLGSSMALWPSDPFTLLNQSGGLDNVLPLRIWVYLLKVILGGTSFFVLVRCFVVRWETAMISAVAYSFCGFIVINGQWDSEATAFVFFPLILWAVVKTLRGGSFIALPIVLAASLMSGVFFVSVGVFLVLVCLAFIMTSEEPLLMYKKWLTHILLLVAIGYLLAAPLLLPAILQLLDSSRVGGGQSLFQKIVQQSLSVNDWPLVLAEIGGIFHKDIFGIGSAYRGYWNYLEGPGFFVGVVLFILIPQLWGGTAMQRRVFLIALASVAAYFIFPVFRYAAMGFAVPYFRVSTLWISLVLMLLAAKAVDQVLENGVNGPLLALGVGVYAFLLMLVFAGSMGANVSESHVIKILGLALLAVSLLLLAYQKVVPARLLPLALLGAVLIESVVIAHPSFLDGRLIVTPKFRGYDDGTLEALTEIRTIDKGIFRVEKTYDSVSLDDAMAQNYMGVKSYFLHSRGVVDFYTGLRLIPAYADGNAVNYTNWLPNAGPRFMLNSLLGVKYIIAREAVHWPGFVAIRTGQDFQLYRNEMALPFGIVQTKQIAQSALAKLASLPVVDANGYRDITIINAVVVDQVVPGFGEPFDLEELLRPKVLSIQETYFEPARSLQATGLHIKQFASNHITGHITPGRAGILVFSIPYSQGWSLKIDGQQTAMIRANFGMLAAPVQAGTHSVELNFRLPGQATGALLGAIGLGLLGLILAVNRHQLRHPRFGA